MNMWHNGGENGPASLVQAFPEALFILKEDLCLAACSGAGKALLVTGAEEQHLPLEEAFAPQSEVWRRDVRAACQRALQTGQSAEWEDTATAIDGRAAHTKIRIWAGNVPGMGSASAEVCQKSSDDGENAAPTVMLLVTDETVLWRARRQAGQAAHSRAAFLGGVSREILTPVQAVKSLAELLSLTKIDTLQQNYVDNIIVSANVLSAAFGDLLDYAQIEAGQAELREITYSVGEMLAEVASAAALRGQVNGAETEIYAPHSMPRKLQGDGPRVKQVLVHLQDAALKNKDSGLVRLELALREEGEQTLLCCTVRHVAPGAQNEAEAAVFAPFAPGQPQAEVDEANLGLAISQKLTRAMGGGLEMGASAQGVAFHFWVPQQVADSRPLAAVKNAGEKHVLVLAAEARAAGIARMLQELGVSCCTGVPGQKQQDTLPFTHCIYDETAPAKEIMRLRSKTAAPGMVLACLRSVHSAPEMSVLQDSILFMPVLVTDMARFLDKMASRAAAVEAQPEAFAVNAVPGGFSAAGAQVLVVEPGEEELDHLDALLRSFSVRAMVVRTGAEAMEECAAQKFDLILLARELPDTGGEEVAARLRGEVGLNWQTPIVAMAAQDADSMKGWYVRCGMDDCVEKPFQGVALARVLARWLPADKLR